MKIDSQPVGPNHSASLISPAYFSKRELAFYLGVSVRTCDNLLAAGKLPYVRFSSRLIRFPRAAVEAYIRDHLTIKARGV